MLEVAMETFALPLHWRRGFPWRMSLRTLMLIVLVAGAGLGWFALERQRDARRKWVIATIQASGASVDFDGRGISRIVWFGGSLQPALNAQRPLTPDQIDALGSCDRLRELMMVASVMTDEGLAELSHDNLLETLYCFKPEITDDGVKHLAGLTSLKKLELLRVPELTDASLAFIARMTNLEELNLSGASINGSGFVHLAKLKSLKVLVIPGLTLDDAGLANLGRLTSLQELYIGGGAYTDTGLASLSTLTGLKKLGIGSDVCTDAGLANFAGLANLEILQFDGPQVTDLWLDRVAAIKSLKEVQIGEVHVSDEAIARLHRSLPEVQIYVDGRRR
jgi:hypothetical protein